MSYGRVGLVIEKYNHICVVYTWKGSSSYHICSLKISGAHNFSKISKFLLYLKIFFLEIFVKVQH